MSRKGKEKSSSSIISVYESSSPSNFLEEEKRREESRAFRKTLILSLVIRFFILHCGLQGNVISFSITLGGRIVVDIESFASFAFVFLLPTIRRQHSVNSKVILLLFFDHLESVTRRHLRSFLSSFRFFHIRLRIQSVVRILIVCVEHSDLNT